MPDKSKEGSYAKPSNDPGRKAVFQSMHNLDKVKSPGKLQARDTGKHKRTFKP